MFTSARNLTPSIHHGAAFPASAPRSSRRSSFSILKADKASSAACYGAIALMVLAGIVVNLVLIARSISSILVAAQ